jgi:hypothetical protein
VGSGAGVNGGPGVASVVVDMAGFDERMMGMGNADDGVDDVGGSSDDDDARRRDAPRPRKPRDGAALSGVDLRLRPGELLGVCGTTGAGKTSLIACLLGELELLRSLTPHGSGSGSGSSSDGGERSPVDLKGAGGGGGFGVGAEGPAADAVVVAGRTSYLAQQPWVGFGTLRENVTLTGPEVCACACVGG